MNTTVPTIIFSVHRANISDLKNTDANRLAKRLFRSRGIPFFEAMGWYKGQLEKSLVLQDVAYNINTVRQLARWFQQESILRIDANRQARLETLDGELIQSLGEFQETRKDIAEQYDAWTECHGRYWIAA